MAGAENTREVVIWTDAAHAGLLGAVLDVMGSAIAPIGLGGPRVAEIDRLAQALDCPREDDLRKLLVEHPAAFCLLGTSGPISAAELLAGMHHGTIVLSLEPVAAELTELRELGEALGRIVRVPAFVQGPGAIHAADPREALGGRRALVYLGAGPRAESSLFARLLDAWATVLAFIDLPETIDASLVGAGGNVPDYLRDVTGIVSAHARTPGAAAAVIQVADRDGAATRTLEVIGDTGRLRISDTGYDLRHTDGSPIDHADESPGGVTCVDLFAAQWRRLLERPPSDSTRIETDALACCLACLLSARTGEPEGPGSILEMSGLRPGV